MSKLTKIKICIAILAVVLLVGSFALRISMHVIPDDYRPYTLSRSAMTSAAVDFRAAVVDLFGSAGKVGSLHAETYESRLNSPREINVSFTADQLNRWLAAMDVKIVRAMAEAGFSDPAIVINDGNLECYVKWDRKSTIICLKLAPSFDSDGRMSLEIVSVKLGALKIPRSWLDEHLRLLARRLQNRLETLQSSGREKLGPLPLEDASSALKQLAGILRKRPVELKFPKRYGFASISDIRLARESITLTVRSDLP